MSEQPQQRRQDAAVRELVGAYLRELEQLGRTTPDAKQLEQYSRGALEILMRCAAEVRRLSESELSFFRSLDRTLISWDVSVADLQRMHSLASAVARRAALAGVDGAEAAAAVETRQIDAVFLAVASQIRADVFNDHMLQRQTGPQGADGGSLARLLAGRVNLDTERESLRDVGFVPAAHYVVVCIECVSGRQDPDHEQEIARRVAALLEERVPAGRYRPVTGVVQGRPTALLPSDHRTVDPVRTSTESIVAELTRWDATGAGALGGPVPTLEILPVAYRRAVRTLDIMRRLQFGSDVMDAREALPYLLLINDPELLADLASVLDRLNGDTKEGMTLIDTAAALAECSGNVVGAARALGVHRHTIYARMKRIEELTGLTPEEGKDRLVLHLGVKARELLSSSVLA